MFLLFLVSLILSAKSSVSSNNIVEEIKTETKNDSYFAPESEATGRSTEIRISVLATNEVSAERDRRSVPSYACQSSKECALICQRKCGIHVKGWCDQRLQKCVCASVVIHIPQY